ncbi:hypothetical protein GGR57DRAFT_456342 [Xylariaceae sp. FL1272]|nr:hypothetical protein GGR57DRAFT_456342 [Xylariaceae sp. FL1272]
MSTLPAATNVPKITAIRQELGYGDIGSIRYNAFIDDVRVFRKKFKTTTGLPGVCFVDWKSPQHQRGLGEMVNAYLEDHGAGAQFWPDSSGTEDCSKLTYPRDELKIKALMTQLFYRSNEQQHRNQKYKHKDKAGPSNHTIDERGHTPENPIDLDDADDEPTIRFKPFNEITNPTPDNIDPALVHGFGNETHRRELKRPRSPLDDSDHYDVPPSPTRDTTKATKVAKKPAKRTSTNKAASKQKKQKSQPDPPHPPHSEAEFSLKRKSPRTKRTLQMDGYATGEDYMAVMTQSGLPPDRVKGTKGASKQPRASASRIGGVVSFRVAPQPSPEIHDTHSSRNTPDLSRDNLSESARSADISRDPSPAIRGPTLDAHRGTVAFTSMQPPRIIPSKEQLQLNATPQQAPEPAPVPTPVSSKKPKIEFIYRIVTRVSHRRWYPTKKLEEMTFAEFTHEVAPSDNAKSLVFRIKVNNFSIDEEIGRGKEFEFKELKEAIRRRIKQELGSREATDDPLVCVIEVEPVMVEEQVSRSVVDDDDFSF